MTTQRLSRLDVIKALGGKCVKCGFDDWRALQIDHRYGGGHQEGLILKPNSQAFYQRVLRDTRSKRPRYQLLCANHNWLKRFENGEHRIAKGHRVTARLIFFLTERDALRLRRLCARSRLRVPVWLRDVVLQCISKYEQKA